MAEEKKNFGDFFKKFWFLLWKDNSFKGWIFSIVFLFVIIKFVFFPLMSLVTGTALPLAIVESCSMYHEGNILSNFNDWFQKHEIKYENIRINQTEFSDFPLRKGFNKGDILLIIRANPEKLKVGDIIIFQAELTNPIIHRIISIKEKTDGSRVFSTMGDNNNGQLPFEKEITENQLVGKASFKLAPYAGWIKLVFFDWKKSQTERGFCVEN